MNWRRLRRPDARWQRCRRRHNGKVRLSSSALPAHIWITASTAAYRRQTTSAVAGTGRNGASAPKPPGRLRAWTDAE
jgi:hypothetical protein